MSELLPNLAALSHAEKDNLILHIFEELKTLKLVADGEVETKISGCLRDAEGGSIFARICGYVSTLCKNDMGILVGIQSTFTPSPNLPPSVSVAESL